MIYGPQTPITLTLGGGQPSPPPKASYREATMRRGHPRRGRVVREEGELLLIEFYATGEEFVHKDDVEIAWRRP